MLSLRHDLNPDCDDHIKGVAGHQVHETRTCPGSVCPTVILRWELQCTSVVLRREAHQPQVADRATWATSSVCTKQRSAPASVAVICPQLVEKVTPLCHTGLKVIGKDDHSA